MTSYFISAWAAIIGAPAELQAVMLTAFLSALYKLFQPKAKLTWGRTSNSFNKIHMDDGSVGIYCAKYYIQNAGRIAISDIEICFISPPREFTIYPAVSFKNEIVGKGSLIVKIGHLSPGELIILDAVDIDSAHEVSSVRSPQCEGKMVEFEVIRKSFLMKSIAGSLMVFGIIFLIQVVISLLRALS